MFRFSALRCFGAIFFSFFFFIRVTKQNGVISVWDQILVHFYLPLPTHHRMDHVPFVLRVTSYSAASLNERKQKLCFSATDLAIRNSSHYPFLGLKLLSLKVPSHSCFVSDSAGEILNSLCTKLFLNFILFWNFASLGLEHTGHPIWLCELCIQFVVWPCADL